MSETVNENSTNISNLFNGKTIDDARYVNRTFNGRIRARMFNNVEFENCVFVDTEFIMVSFFDVKFRNCEFRNCIFFGCIMPDTLFESCNFSFSQFKANNMLFVHFFKCTSNLSGLIMEMNNILYPSVQETTIFNYDRQGEGQALLFDDKNLERLKEKNNVVQ